MFQALKKWLGGAKRFQSGIKRCTSPRQARLGLEQLESRELLSASVADFSLSNGNLYNTTGTQAQLIDTGVQSFSVTNGKVIDLHTDGVVDSLNPDGSSITSLLSDARSIAVDGQGNLFALSTLNGSIREYTGQGTSWTAVTSAGIQFGSMAVDGTGNLFALETTQQAIFEHKLGAGNSWTQVGSGSTTLVADATRNVYERLTDGTVWEHVRGTGWDWKQIGSGSTTLLVDATGNLFERLADGSVWEHVQGTGWDWIQVGIGSSTLVTDAMGDLFSRTSDGSVWEHVQGTGWDWTQVGSGTTTLLADATDNLFSLTSDGTVLEHILGEGAGWNQVSSGSTTLLSDATGNLFARLADGTVWEHVQGTSSDWNQVGSGSTTLVEDGLDNLFSRTSDGSVWEHIQGDGSGWNQVGSGSITLLVDATHILFERLADGTVWEHVRGTGWDWKQMGSGSTTLVADATGNLFERLTDGTVWEHIRGTSWDWAEVGSGSTTLLLDATGNLFERLADGSVWEHVQGAGWDWIQVGSGSTTLVTDATDNLFSLTSDGTVWEHVLGAGWSWNQVGSGYSDLVSDASGNLFALMTAQSTVYEHDLGTANSWSTAMSGVTTMIQANSANPYLYVLSTDGTLQSGSSLGSLSVVDREVYDLYMNSGGNVQYDDRFETLPDAGVGNLARTLYTRDDQLTWSDIVQIFQEVEQDGVVTANELSSLQHLFEPFEMESPSEAVYGLGVSLNMSDSLRSLAINVLNHSNLTGSAQELQAQVNKWLLGEDHPDYSTTWYSPVSASLFGPNGPSYLDVAQGDVGDCWLMASLAEVAARDPGVITSMFTYDGNIIENGSVVGVYTVRFYDSTSGVAEYVTVDTELPDGGNLYDHVTNPLGSTVLWVALAEKAYVVANEDGFVQTGDRGSDSYNALSGGSPPWALYAITGWPASDYDINPTDIANAWNSGKLVVLGTGLPPSSMIVSDHAYALVGYNPSSSEPYTVYNPWGTDSNGWAPGSSKYGLFIANAAYIAQNFSYFAVGGAAHGEASSTQGAANMPGDDLVGNSAGFSAIPQGSRATNVTDLLFCSVMLRKNEPLGW